ncbi:PH domain-containing protein [Streptomyces anulatus]|uniref:PH domain-containing protein n=1 Tax=Streptomyces anulatus TaxID=1892 RepID=A0A7K3REN5_STRAQ|nr:PH domain-containing protein [Streptomyces anulatus]NEC00649.1 PH domain-containing protein [Streptomyces anulatus]NED30863.1 PH domain-containing protein [Streptomyces anulatus]
MPQGEGTAVALRPPRNTLNERAVGWWRAQWLLLTAVPVVPLAVLGALIEPARFWLLLPAAVLAAAGTAAAVLLPLWWFRTHRWEITEDAVYVRTGYFRQEWRIAPMSRIQTVDTVRGPLEQLFRLATVTVTTASAKGAVRIAGLDHEVAADLARRLTRITRDTPGDAT